MAAAVLLWPPVQMTASLIMGFTPWRLAGWGMYSTPHPRALTEMKLFESGPDGERPFVVDGLTAEQAADISERYDRVLHFRRERDIERLVERVRELMPQAARPRRFVVLLRDRRISVLGGYLYGIETRYLYEEGRLRKLPTRGPTI